MFINRRSLSKLVFGPALISVCTMAPTPLHAQAALEEIVVTAQRREQSLQEVPISIEVFGGAEISRQGYRDMQELTNFSPTVSVDPDILRSSITIRGLGAAASDSLTVEESSPTFVDGIHYGRTSQIKLAFLDLQSVEVLKGPQPVYFGQNAIAGAFNLTTRKPTPEWQGFATAEYGSDDTAKVEFGIGGPVTDTLGIRFAGLYERSDGYMVDVVTGDKFPPYENYGARVILRWNPNDRFQATWKFEASDMNKGAQGNHICVVPGEEGLLEPQYVLLDPPLGVGWDVEHKPLGECYASNDGIIPSGRIDPPTGAAPPAVAENGNTALTNLNGTAGIIPQVDGNQYSYESRENIEPWNTYLELTYTFDNGVEINSLTGFDHYLREYLRDNRGTPFYANFQNREEDQYSLSQELRISSPVGGAYEWMVGAYYQKVDYDIFSDSIRPNMRTARRYNWGYEDAEWSALFGNLTFNFLDDRMSVDIGARYSNSDKETYVRGWGAQWIMADGFIQEWSRRSRPGSAEFLLYNGQKPVGMTELVPVPCDTGLPYPQGRVNLPADYPFELGNACIPGPYTGLADRTELNPQLVVRYRPNDDTSVYAKYAESFKAAAFNTGQATLPPSFDEYGAGPEFGKNYELGAKGNLANGKARYTVTVFRNEVDNLQTASARANLAEQNNLLSFGNAGAQEVTGVEFAVDWLATDNWALNLSGALMDGVMKDFFTPCTEPEFLNPEASGCVLDPVDPDDDALAFIDRSNTQAPNTPDWKFVLTSNYVWRLANGYELEFNAKGYVSDGYITDTNGFSLVTMYDQHEDLSLRIGFGPHDARWQLAAFGRNLLEAHESYHAQYDLEAEPIRSPVMYRTNFATYGVQFKYNYGQ